MILSNNNERLLKYIVSTKEYFNITSTGPYLSNRAGTTIQINLERHVRKINIHQIAIYRKGYIMKFLDKIEFSITDIQLGLTRRK